MRQQAPAMKQAWHLWEIHVQSIHQLAAFLVEMQVRRLTVAAGVQSQTEILRQLVGI